MLLSALQTLKTARPFGLALAALASLSLACTDAALAHPQPVRLPGSLVSVTIETDGEAAPLYPAPDGSGRLYVEAKRDRPYAVRLANRTGQRLGVVLTIDGLNAVSGEREADGRGRMYVLDPWASALIQGWRTSLAEVRSFTFVDEKASYSARSGKANARMGWIEVAVFREVQPHPWISDTRPPRPLPDSDSEAQPVERRSREENAGDSGRAEAGAAAPPATMTADGTSAVRRPSEPGGSFPGTGWGDRRDDRVEVVQFDPEPTAADRVTLRYEYRSALYALGILPRPAHRDRLREREAGGGFAQPPAW